MAFAPDAQHLLETTVMSMSEHRIELTRPQQELLLRGLRFVRSSVALDACNFTDEVDAERRRHYAEISELESLVRSVPVSQAAGV